jgi:hypothetical protein
MRYTVVVQTKKIYRRVIYFLNSNGSLEVSGSPEKYPCGPPLHGVESVEPEFKRVSFICWGVLLVELAFISAAAAATEGDAILVPLSTAYSPLR